MRILTFLLFAVCCVACHTPVSNNESSTTAEKEINPAATGFNAANSDAKAIAIADKVMEAMGGRAAWDETRLLTWTFFGRRTLTWDKHTGDVSIQIPETALDIRLNVQDTLMGQVLKGGENIGANKDTLSKYLAQGRSIWINDSYWLVMPFKLKDSGVTLNYIGQDTTQTGGSSEVLSLTFEGVGNTPENKYHVYVDAADYLIKQWDFFQTAQDSSARFSTPWADYEQHGTILLSGNRGRAQLSDIAVYNEIPDSIAARMTLK